MESLVNILWINTTEWGPKNLTMTIIWILVFFWIIIIIRTAKDISARTNNTFFHIISILFVTLLTPIIGLPLYLAIRPIWYKRDKIPRRDSCLSSSCMCQNCWTLNPKEYKSCIKCGSKLIVKCKECDKEYPNEYHYCPSCWAPNIE